MEGSARGGCDDAILSYGDRGLSCLHVEIAPQLCAMLVQGSVWSLETQSDSPVFGIASDRFFSIFLAFKDRFHRRGTPMTEHRGEVHWKWKVPADVDGQPATAR